MAFQGLFTIGAAATGAAVDPLDLGRRYAFLLVRVADAQYIQAATTMTAQVGAESDDTMIALYRAGASGAWQSGTLPTSGGFQFLLADAFGVRRIRFVLSQNSGAGSVAFRVYGLDRAD